MIEFANLKDYRDFLQNHLEEKKKQRPSYSLRQMATELKMHPSQLLRVLRREQNVPPKSLALVKEMLHLSSRASKYFDLMVSAAYANDDVEREEFFAKAFALRNVQQKKLKASELKTVDAWWTPVVRSLLEVTGGICDERYLARMITPEVPSSDVKKSIEQLLATGQIKKIASGKYKLAEDHVVASDDLAKHRNVVHNYQGNVLKLAAKMLPKIDKEKRLVATLVFAVDEECLEDIKELCQEFRHALLKRIDKVTIPDRVVQMALAMFPVAEKECLNNA